METQDLEYIRLSALAHEMTDAQLIMSALSMLLLDISRNMPVCNILQLRTYAVELEKRAKVDASRPVSDSRPFTPTS